VAGHRNHNHPPFTPPGDGLTCECHNTKNPSAGRPNNPETPSQAPARLDKPDASVPPPLGEPHPAALEARFSHTGPDPHRTTG